MAKTSFSGPVHSAAGFVGAINLPAYTVATAPSAADAGAGAVIFVSNGNAGDPTLAVSDGTDWLSSAGNAIATS